MKFLALGNKMCRPAMLIIAVLLAGCATMGIETRSKITADGFKPLKVRHRSEIEIFEKGKPARPYREVATIKALGIDKSTNGGLLEAMQIRAAKLGVDGLTDIRFFSEPVTGGPTGTMTCPTWMECTYLGGDSFITSRPAAESTAIVYGESPGPGTRTPEPGKTKSAEPIHMPESPDEMLDSESSDTTP